MTKSTLPNTGRQLEFDLAKVFAIFFMVWIHVFETVNGTTNGVLPSDWQTLLVEFLGGPLAAPIFLLSMGVGMVYTRHNSPSDFAKRGLQLLGLGYLLNFLRGVVPILLGQALTTVTDAHLAVDMADYSLLENLLTVDILPFAGLTFLFIAGLKQLNQSTIQIVLTALVLLGLGMATGKLSLSNSLLTQLTGLFVYSNEFTSFPLFLWFIYPVTGMLLGQQLQKTTDKDRFYRQMGYCALVLFLTTSTLSYPLAYDVRYHFTSDFYYQQNFLSYLWIMSIVGLVLPLYHLLAMHLKTGKLLTWTAFIGSNLNQIYIIHWLIVPYIIGTVSTLSFPASILVSLLVMLTAIIIRKVYVTTKK